jgi:hypothetical protein
VGLNVTLFYDIIFKMNTEPEIVVHLTTSEKLEEYREERYEELGFTPKEARRLAKAKDEKGYPLNWRVVRKARNAGCTPEQALKIWT